VALLVAVLMLVWPVAASAVDGSSVDAPGLTAGPFITDAGLVWESPHGFVLTNSRRGSTVLAPLDAPNRADHPDLAWFGLDWWAIARPEGVFAGRIGGPIRKLPLLGKCNPATTPEAEMVQYAISGHHLYAALPKGCLARRSAPSGELVDFDLRSHRSHVLTPMPGTLDYIAASGKYLALAYWRSPQRPRTERRLLVRVLNDTTGAVANQIRPPPTISGNVRSSMPSGVQVDDLGDVLVTKGSCGEPPGPRLAHVAQPYRPPPEWWWARAGSKVGHRTQLGNDAVLSHGRVAFFTAGDCVFGLPGSPGGTIEVKNLLAGLTRTVVVFSGSLAAQGLALSSNRLAWAQESTVFSVVRGVNPGGGSFEECGYVPLSPVELASADLRHVPSTPVVFRGAPVPPQYANEPPCLIA
jgi:hypothetical protein